MCIIGDVGVVACIPVFDLFLGAVGDGAGGKGAVEGDAFKVREEGDEAGEFEGCSGGSARSGHFRGHG